MTYIGKYNQLYSDALFQSATMITLIIHQTGWPKPFLSSMVNYQSVKDLCQFRLMIQANRFVIVILIDLMLLRAKSSSIQLMRIFF